jgi:hypothetical protein
MRRRGIARERDGSYRVSLDGPERDLLRALPEQLRGALEVDDPSLRRLFPPAYEDAEAEREFRSLVRESLLDGKLEALRVFEQTAHEEHLSEQQLSAWLGALESLRLVLGTQLDVTEETYAREIDPRDPEAARLALYGWLSWLQEETVEALTGALPADGRPAPGPG